MVLPEAAFVPQPGDHLIAAIEALTAMTVFVVVTAGDALRRPITTPNSPE